MSEIRVTTLKDTSGGNSSTTEQIASGRAKAWVNFNGANTVAIRASFNVNTITDNATGKYTVNFTNALSDANFVITTSASELGSTGTADWYTTAGRSTNYSDLYVTTSCKIAAVSGGGSEIDPGVVSVAIFR